MESLKKASKHALVIMVTHNEKLARLYSDRIIHMKDGRITKDERINALKEENQCKRIKRNKSNLNWFNQIVWQNFIKRFKRNLFSISALTIGLTSSILIFGFTNGARESISLSAERQFDYGVASISKENRITSNDSPITLIQTIRMSDEEMDYLKGEYDFVRFNYSYDALISPLPNVFYNDNELKSISYLPVYSYIDKSTDHSLIYKGKAPMIDTLNQVIINQTAYELLKKEIKEEPLNKYLRIKDSSAHNFYTEDVNRPYITDYFVFDQLVQIVGVVKELSFLNTPKIFYSYTALDRYMNETLLNNLSSYQGAISWKERIINASNNEVLSNYSHKVFLKNRGDIYQFKSLKDTIDPSFSLSCNALIVEETLFSLVDAASVGLEVFLAIALVGTSLIIGIISFASFCEDIKDSAILLCLGAKRDDVTMLYVIENMIIGSIGLALSFAFSMLLENPLNLLVERLTSLTNIVNIPFQTFHHRTFLFPILITFGAYAICFIATYLPIAFSKRISLKEELKAND